MHITGFVTAASKLPSEILAVVFEPLPHTESSVLAVIRQAAIQKGALLPHSTGRKLVNRQIK